MKKSTKNTRMGRLCWTWDHAGTWDAPSLMGDDECLFHYVINVDEHGCFYADNSDAELGVKCSRVMLCTVQRVCQKIEDEWIKPKTCKP